MRIKKKIFLLILPLIFHSVSFGEVSAAAIDDELAIISAEQDSAEGGKVETFNPTQNLTDETETKSKKELRAEKKAAEKKLKEEQKAARKQIKEGRKESGDEDKKTSTPRRTPPVETTPTVEKTPPVEPEVSKANLDSFPKIENTIVKNETQTLEPPVEEFSPAEQNPTGEITSEPFKTGLPNPIVTYQTFAEVVDAVHFIPLYVPKKSGYSMNTMMVIDNNIAEIRYGRRWEPEVSLHVRTYKRPDGEELKDISGVYGAKWRIDTTTGTTIYIAKIEESKHVAAWAVGNYTFSAYVENLSFAAFHSIVADELVDLSNHYYIG